MISLLYYLLVENPFKLGALATLLYNGIMLTLDMTLNQMVNFNPSFEEMQTLPLYAVTYLKVNIISLTKEDNYNFINFFFNDTEINDYINDIPSAVVYDFDATATDQEKFISILELTGKTTYNEISIYLEELLNKYTHEANVIIDIYTHDLKKYRLSNLEEIVKLEECNG